MTPVSHDSWPSTRESRYDGEGRLGAVESTEAKLNAPVMSPTVLSRQLERLGTVTPAEAKREANSLSGEVWSSVPLYTKPPLLNGETTSIGTRKPRPMGSVAGTAPVVTNSPAVPAGGVGGLTWSKKPPFSS